MTTIACYQANSRFIPAAYQAAQAIEFVQRQGLDDALLFRGGTLHRAEVGHANRLLTPAEYLHLLDNLALAMPEGETSFLLGEQLLPGHLGPISHALLQAGNLGQALDLLLRYQAWLSPLLAPHLMHLGKQTVLYWTDSYVSTRLRGFVTEMMMSAVSGMSRWLSGERLPWQYSFNRTKPAHIEQYSVHLGSNVRFNAYFDAMAIDNSWLDRPWPRGSALGVGMTKLEADRQIGEHAPRSLLAALYDHLHKHVRMAPTLEQTCSAFGSSPATFKRHLALHGTHFQAELDLVRTHTTLQLIHNHGYSNEQIAAYLGFHDANNFRRSLKRWTGLTPSSLRSEILDPAGKQAC